LRLKNTTPFNRKKRKVLPRNFQKKNLLSKKKRIFKILNYLCCLKQLKYQSEKIEIKDGKYSLFEFYQQESIAK
jgi:hypothetical protein